MLATKRKPAVPSPPGTEHSARRDQIGATVLLLGLGFVLYAPALGAGFIWDDGRALANNPVFQAPHALWNIWTGQGDADYFPLKTTVLWLLYQIFGAHPAPYHVLNVAVHAANAVLLWHGLRRLAIPGAGLAGLVFLAHPTHVESVAWVSECKNTLSTGFALLALLAWLTFEQEHRLRYYLAALVLFVAGLLCKTHVVILPVVLVLCAWWQAGRDGASKPARPALIARLGPFFLVAILFGGITIWFQNTRAIREYQLPVGGLASRVANAGKATWWYLGKAISPVNLWYEMPERPVETEPEAQAVLAGTRAANPAPAWPRGRLVLCPLSMIYPRWRVTSPLWYDFLPLAAMAALFVWVVRLRKGRGRGVCFALSYFLLALLPVLGLLKMSYMRAAWVADHFQYLADIGIIALGCAGGTLLWRRASRVGRRWVAGAGAAVIGILAVATVVRAADYRSEYTLWTDTVAKNPGAWQAQTRLGAALLERGDVRGAAEHFAQGVRLKPDDADSRNNLGLALVTLGRIDEGIAQYRESVRLHPGQFFAHANLGDVLARQKQYGEAAAAYREAIRLQPALAPLHYRLGVVLLDGSKPAEAIVSLERAAALAPHHPEITAALERARRAREAALRPGYAEVQ
jgi:tetratricopeptide (TPR) repeat protein